jgi:hypothetical protein
MKLSNVNLIGAVVKMITRIGNTYNEMHGICEDAKMICLHGCNYTSGDASLGRPA